MLISPPFLPQRGATQTESQWLDAAMPAPPSRLSDTGAPEGAFPLSHSLAWHNGMHLQAPQAGGGDLPVRAIADGMVIFVGKPTTSNTSLDDPQNYNPFDRPGVKTAAWTDNGCIIIEHRTTIGTTGATETEVVFYSLYMHLSALGRTTPEGQTTKRIWKAGDPIWRKDEVGTPGKIYGHGGQIHFEVCLDTANLQQLIGRAPSWVAPATSHVPTADGRTDSIFGSMYFYLPANTPIDTGTNRPAAGIRQSGSPTLDSPLWVKMSYAQGACQFESYNERGDLIGSTAMVANVEYNLYQDATDRHKALTTAQQASSSPSGWYELLRFGRNIGHGTAATDKDPLPTDAAHWRRICGPAGIQLWADLNAQGSFKFSDADFLPIIGWNCIADDTSPNDQRCDSAQIKSLICDQNPSNASRMEASELVRRLGDAGVQAKLKRTICKFPSEWDKASISSRYAFVMEYDSFKQNPQAWANLESHLNAISFDGLPANYLAADWHINPKEFVGQMRQCGWRSNGELSQTFPRHLFYTATGVRAAITTPASTYSLSKATALARIQGHGRDLNRVMRKYGIATAQRQAQFLAQVMLETAQWRNIPPSRLLMHEWGFGAYSAANPMTQYYAAFYGRGIMQLTWASNYRDYGNYRSAGGLEGNTGTYIERLTPNAPRITQTSLHWTGNPSEGANQIVWAPNYDPDVIATDPFNACDSGGFYWVSKHHGGEININRVCDREFSPASVGRVSVLVNGGGNGYYERQAYAAFMFRLLSESVETTAEIEITPPAPKSRVRASFLKPT